MAKWLKSKDDIGIYGTTAGQVEGFRLLKKNGIPDYHVFDRKNLATQFFTGTPQESYQDPQEEIPMRQSSYRSGFGQEFYDPSEPERYYSSIGMDLRHKGMAIAGWTPTAVTLPTLPLLVNENFELTTGWTLGSRSTAQVYEGTYSWQVNDGITATQDLIWDASYQSKAFKFYCWVLADIACVANKVYVAIYDGKTVTESSAHPTDGAWHLLTASKTLAADATELQVQLINKSGSNTNLVYFDDSAISPGAGIGAAFSEFNDELYLGKGSTLLKLNAGGTAFTDVSTTTLQHKITDMETFTNDELYIAQGQSNAYVGMTTAEAFTLNTLTNNTAQFMQTVHTATPIMWINTSDNEIRYTADPKQGGTNYSVVTTVGSSADAITALIDQSGALYIMKEDMPYYLDSAGAVQNDLAPELRSNRASTSGKNVILWKGNLYIPCGTQSLVEVGDAITYRDPADYAQNLGDFVGRVMATASDGRYLYIAVDNDTKVEILAGRTEDISGTDTWVWHPIAELTLAGVNTMFVSTVVQNRLWIASTLSTDSVYYIPLPTKYGDITNDTNAAFKTGTYFITSYHDGLFPDDKKGFPELILNMGHTYDADIYFTVHYQKLEDTTWTSIGNFTGSSTSMSETRYLPDDHMDYTPSSTHMRLKFTAVTDDTAKTPVLLSYKLNGILYPSPREIIACRVVVGRGTLNAQGGMSQEFTRLITVLDELRTATFPVQIADIDGNTKYVRPLPLPQNTPRWDIVKDEQGREQERVFNLLLLVVPLS